MALGVLDWGIGGLGFVQALWRRAPAEPVVYLSDSGATPYGKLTAQALARRVERAVSALHEAGADHVVIACNAASSVAERIRSDVPVMSIIAAGVACVPPALRGTLWVLGGERIVRSGLYTRALRRDGRHVRGRIAQPLSAHIEAGSTGSAAFAEALAEVLAPVRDGDGLLLACTHYPAITPDFRRLRPLSAIFEPADTLANTLLQSRLAGTRGGESRFFTTGSVTSMERGAQSAWGLTLPAVTAIAIRD